MNINSSENCFYRSVLWSRLNTRQRHSTEEKSYFDLLVTCSALYANMRSNSVVTCHLLSAVCVFGHKYQCSHREVSTTGFECSHSQQTLLSFLISHIISLLVNPSSFEAFGLECILCWSIPQCCSHHGPCAHRSV